MSSPQQQQTAQSSYPRTTPSTPSEDEVEDIILSARYGELEEIQAFVKQYGSRPIVEAKDERGNGCLHMAAGNGHDDIISFLLPLFPADLLASVNKAGNTPLHWAALNGHLSTLRLLVPALPKSALFLQNQFGRTPLSEAEANAPESLSGDNSNSDNKQASSAPPAGEQEAKPAVSAHLECAGYLLEFMELEAMRKEGKSDDQQQQKQQAGEEDEDVTIGVAKMGVAASNGEFEFVEHKPASQ